LQSPFSTSSWSPLPARPRLLAAGPKQGRLQEGLPAPAEHRSVIARARRRPGGPVASGGAGRDELTASWRGFHQLPLPAARSALATPANALGVCCPRAASGGIAE
jgi:hypothetical protein